MKKIDIKQIMEESGITDHESKSGSITDKTPKNIHKKFQFPHIDDSFLEGQNFNDLIGFLKSYQKQFLEISSYQSLDPVFSDFGNLQQDLNDNYSILDQKRGINGFLQRVFRKVLGVKDVLGQQEKVNAITTRLMNKSIEVNTSLKQENFQLRTQVFFLSLQSKIVSRILEEIQQTIIQMDRDRDHEVRKNEYLSSIIPEIHDMCKDMEEFLKQQGN